MSIGKILITRYYVICYDVTKISFLPDAPIESGKDDSLGVNSLVDVLEQSIYNTRSPFTFGLLGDWGSGKTSILKLLKERLNKSFELNTNYYIPIWFDAWIYESEANIIFPLLYTIKKRFESFKTSISGKDDKSFLVSFSKVFKASVFTFADVGIRVLTKKYTGEAIKLKDIKEHMELVENNDTFKKIEEVLGDWTDQVAKLNESFKALLDSYAIFISEQKGVNKELIKFVFIIDDLDRCTPDNSISILEGIKNHLSVDRCIFILGLNNQVIQEGIRVKFKGLDIDGRQYLEKILNYSFQVPEMNNSFLVTFVLSQFKQIVTYEFYEKKKQYFIDFSEVIKESNFFNPRKIKRILNTFIRYLLKENDCIKQYYTPNIVRLLIIIEYFPEIYVLLLNDATNAKGLLEQLQNLGNSNVNYDSFESKYGISLKNKNKLISQSYNVFGFEVTNNPQYKDKSIKDYLQVLTSV